jgi:uncharacterized protein (TIGR02588 family)
MKHAKLEKNWLEWCVFGAGSVIVLSAIAYLTYKAASVTDRPPLLEVKIGAAKEQNGLFATPVTVINHGLEAAEAALIEVELTKTDGGSERAELQIQVLPGEATREAYVNFRTNPGSAASVTGRAVSFESK